MGDRPRLLDLFCGAGGASKGYADAGFDVVGVDIAPHPSYPYAFVQADALTVLEDQRFLDRFAVVHASPPCQELTRARHLRDAQGGTLKPTGRNVIPEVRDALAGRLYVLENVPDAAPWMRDPVTLCGSAFGLAVRRHRLFESPAITADPWAFAPPACRHADQGRPVGVYGRWADEVPDGGRTARTIEEARTAMGIDWMRWRSRTQEWDDLKEAIPPAYTRHLGQFLLAALVAQ